MVSRFTKWFLSIVALGGSLYFLYMVRNLERKKLNDEARAQAPGAFVRLPWGKVHYQLEGPPTAPTVVLVHGLSVPLFVWDGTYEALLEAGYRVLRFDLFGRGYSDRPRAEYTVEFFSGQLHDLLAAVGIDKPVHLMGVSMGGAIVAHYASRHPEHVAGVVLEAPFHEKFDIGVLRLPAIGEFVMCVQWTPTLAAGVLDDFYNPETAVSWPDKYRVQLQYEGFRQALLSTYRLTINQDQKTWYEQLGHTDKPVLLIWGQEDPLIPFSGSRELLHLLPQAHFVPVSEAGHLPHAERPEQVHEWLLNFLRQVDAQK